MKTKIYKTLDNLDIKYDIQYHEAVVTADEFHEATNNMPGHHCKNLFLKNSRGNEYYLLVAKHDKAVDLKKVRREIGSTRLSFGHPEKLYELLKVTPGSVNPFSMINDEKKEVKLLIDSDLLDGQSMNFHPSINTETFNISLNGFEKFTESINCSFIRVNI